MRRIVIVVHEKDTFGPPYFLLDMARQWPSSGFSVVVQNGLSTPPDAELAILHVDLTRVPEAYAKLVERYPRVVNGRVLDISKRAISRQGVERGDGYDGPVIVKSNLNWGGIREFALQGAALSREFTEARLNYQLYDTPAEVPDRYWEDDTWFVERFLPERRDGYYCLRTWTFFGDRESNSLSYSTEPIVKSHSVVRREVVPGVPEELRRVRASLGVDFGKFDYVMIEGRPVLLDVNKTPSRGQLVSETARGLILELGQGIHSFFGGS